MKHPKNSIQTTATTYLLQWMKPIKIHSYLLNYKQDILTATALTSLKLFN